MLSRLHWCPEALLPGRPSEHESRQKHQVSWFLVTLVEITEPVPSRNPHAPCSFSCTDLSLFPRVCLLGIFPSHRFVDFTTKSICCISLYFFTLHFNQNLGFRNACHVSILTPHGPLSFLPPITKLGVGLALCPHLPGSIFNLITSSALRICQHLHLNHNTRTAKQAGSASSLLLHGPPITSTSHPH